MPVPAFPATSEATHEEGFLNSVDHLRLYWQRYRPPAPRATVAVLHGGGDHSGRYPALTTALVRAGLEVALVDFRGHGQSDGRRWHVDVFGDYLADLDAFLASLRAGGVTGKLFVLGHSQGGLIAARWALEHGRDGGVDGLVLSSPYLRLALEAPLLKVLAARVMGKVVPWLPVSTGIAPSALTSDPELQTWTAHDPLYGRATTPRWFEESTRAQEEVVRRAGELEAPLLVVAAGADTIADVGASRRFVEAARSADKKLVVYDGFRHELFNEVGRERPIAEVVSWISARCG